MPVKRLIITFAVSPPASLTALRAGAADSLSRPLRNTSDLGELRELRAAWNDAAICPGMPFVDRAARFRGGAVIQTDHPQDPFRPVMDAIKTNATRAKSGPGFHSTAMFLVDRPSTRRSRGRFWKLVENPRS